MKVRLLKEARELINYKSEKYICFAITRVAVRNIRNHPYSKEKAISARDDLHRWIVDMLGRDKYDYRISSIEDWMRYHHPRVYARMDSDDFIQARLDWIDWMISYLEEFENGSVKKEYSIIL